jgi:hypothetical protein
VCGTAMGLCATRDEGLQLLLFVFYCVVCCLKVFMKFYDTVQE